EGSRNSGIGACAQEFAEDTQPTLGSYLVSLICIEQAQQPPMGFREGGFETAGLVVRAGDYIRMWSFIKSRNCQHCAAVALSGNGLVRVEVRDEPLACILRQVKKPEAAQRKLKRGVHVSPDNFLGSAANVHWVGRQSKDSHEFTITRK